MIQFVTAEGKEILFPEVAVYRRKKNRVYFISDFEDGEVIQFFSFTDRRSSTDEGYAFYIGGTLPRIVNIKELEALG